MHYYSHHLDIGIFVCYYHMTAGTLILSFLLGCGLTWSNSRNVGQLNENQK